MKTQIYEATGPFRNVYEGVNQDLVCAIVVAYGIDPMDCFRTVLVNDSAYFWTYDTPPQHILGELFYNVTRKDR